MNAQLGNTLCKDTIVYAGTPFASRTRNKEVLLSVFPDGDVVLEDKTDDDNNEYVIAKMPAKDQDGTNGNNIWCAVGDDRITVAFLFPPQTAEELATAMSCTQATRDKIGADLINLYGLTDSSLILEGKRLLAQTRNVPCLNWLKKMGAVLQPSDIIPKQKQILEDNWILAQDALRPTTLSFALHTIPYEVEDASENVQRKMECISKFEIGVENRADWEKGFGAVGALLRNMKSDAYINILNMVTKV